LSKAKVAILMGSKSDLPIMEEAKGVLDKFGINYEMKVLSCHRSPRRAFKYAEGIEKRGIEVIIAGCGGAAHLPGVIASLTPLPVIGVPIKTSSLGGVDSLYSMVQMPPGVPVATMSINGAKNAGLLAAQILGVRHPQIREKVRRFKEKMEDEVKSEK